MIFNAVVFLLAVILLPVEGNTNTTAATKTKPTQEPVKFIDRQTLRKEIKVKAGDREKLTCPSYHDLAVVIHWMKDEEKNIASADKRYTLAGLRKNILIIDKVDYSDRAVFKCIVTHNNQTKTHEFTLRVRDPLGALWPFLGILIEAVILLVTIIAYEKCNKEKKNGDTPVSLLAVQENGE